MTAQEHRDLALALFGSLVGGFVGYFVGKKTHPVIGTATGALVAAVGVPLAVEKISKRSAS